MNIEREIKRRSKELVPNQAKRLRAITLEGKIEKRRILLSQYWTMDNYIAP